MITHITEQFIIQDQTLTTYGIDTPKNCRLGESWWYNYPVQDFVYKFNSDGFRGNEHNIKEKVFIALGDSFTMNMGGPIEFSWPSILSKYLGKPVINLGVHGIGNDAISQLYELAHEKFDIMGTFVMYSFLHRRLKRRQTIQMGHPHEQNVEYFLKYRLNNVIECALPGYTQTRKEKEFWDSLGIYSYSSKSHTNYNSTYDEKRLLYVDKEAYNNVRGTSWCTYDDFINGGPTHEDMFNKNYSKFITTLPDYTNRDGLHMNYNLHKAYAKYMYDIWTKS